jgi:hypothetical protein
MYSYKFKASRHVFQADLKPRGTCSSTRSDEVPKLRAPSAASIRSVKCLQDRVKCLTDRVKCLTDRVKCLTDRVKRLTDRDVSRTASNVSRTVSKVSGMSHRPWPLVALYLSLTPARGSPRTASSSSITSGKDRRPSPSSPPHGIPDRALPPPQTLPPPHSGLGTHGSMSKTPLHTCNEWRWGLTPP